jgi:butyryl-CoA dehydrogenase
MDQLLSEQNRQYQARARELARTAGAPIAVEYDREAKYPWPFIEALRESGLTRIWFPKEYGGEGAGVLDMCLVVEEISRVCGGLATTYLVNALGSRPLLTFGTEEQKKKYLPGIASGETLLGFALSERASGSDAGSLTCSARRDGDHWVLNGVKKWNSNGQYASLNTVFATVDRAQRTRGVCAFLVEKTDPGYRVGKVEDTMGIRCTPIVELHLEDCRIPADRLLGGVEGQGFKQAMTTLDFGRPTVAAQAVGIAQGALDHALNYACTREQFGKPISSLQALQFMLADMDTLTSAARELTHNVARAIDAGASNVGRLASHAKVFASDTAMKVTTDAVQIFGGYGFCRDYPVEKYMRDAKITQIYEGTNQIQRVVIARDLIKSAERALASVSTD